jgi:putative spermidine/putrescine transport system substrate-binding protein
MDERKVGLPELDGLSRRRFLELLGASAILAMEAGRPLPSAAEDKFTIASTGGSWGEGVKQNFVVATDFEKRYKLPVAYSHQLESVAAAKIVANCGKPIFSVSTHWQTEAVLMADAGCVVGYNLDLVTNYRDIWREVTLEQRPGLGPYYAMYILAMWGLTWNTKLAKKPASYKDLWNPEYKGKVAVPTYAWFGINWLHAVNKLFGGNEDNITPGIQAVAELVRKNNAIIMENVDHGMKLFQREEIAIAPFWNGRTFALQDGGLPVAIEYVENSVAAGAGFLIMKGTAFPEVAQRFVNDTLDERYQLGMARMFKYTPTSRKITLPPDLERARVAERELERTARLDWKKINDHRGAYLERWNKEVLGKG